MNFFFGMSCEKINSELQIPVFRNRSPNNEDLNLFELTIINNRWNIKNISDNKFNSGFYFLDKEKIDNHKIFFLAKKEDLKNFDHEKLKKFNSFTSTSPAYRSNFKVYLDNGGFSSYQAEYPFSMINIKGGILSSVGTLLNKNAEKNFLLFRNIYIEPIMTNFFGYFVDIKKKKILKKFSLTTNCTTLVEVDKLLIKPEIYLVTENYIGIPIYLTIDNNHLSFEHTHPPHEYFFGNSAFKNVKILKERINEIIK